MAGREGNEGVETWCDSRRGNGGEGELDEGALKHLVTILNTCLVIETGIIEQIAGVMLDHYLTERSP